MIKKIYFFVFLFILIFNNCLAKSSVFIVTTINNTIITNLDIKKEVSYLKILNPQLEKLDNKRISNIAKKINSLTILDAEKINNESISKLEKFNCLIIDNYNNNIDENILYTILNQSKQIDRYIVVNSLLPLKDMKFSLKDLKSRAKSFVNLGIELPTDDLLRVIISKFFSEKQIDINPKISEYIIKNIERSYEKVFKFIKDVDELSLSTGKSININLIKKVLVNE